MPPTTCKSEPHHRSLALPQYQQPPQNPPPTTKPTLISTPTKTHHHPPSPFSTPTKTHHPDLNPIKTVTEAPSIPTKSWPQSPNHHCASWPQSPTTNPWSLTESRWVSKQRQCDEKGREMMPRLWGRTKERKERVWESEQCLRRERIRNQ